MEDLEVIEFIRPDDVSKKLYIPNLTESPAGRPPVQDQLDAKFSAYGLLYGVAVIAADDTKSVTSLPEPGDDVYAFVTFYSARAAHRAKRELAGRLLVNGQLATIKFARPRPSHGNKGPAELYIAKCYELANHYLGFNAWTSRILKLEPETDTSDVTSHTVRVSCVVQIRLSEEGLHTEGASIAHQSFSPADPCAKGVALCRARKQAYHCAMQDAWRKVVLVLLSDGHVHVEVNTTLEEQLNFDDELDKKSMIKVRECRSTPLLDSDEEEAMDDMNVHILHDLENSVLQDGG